jgi:hypothetical protein
MGPRMREDDVSGLWVKIYRFDGAYTWRTLLRPWSLA